MTFRRLVWWPVCRLLGHDPLFSETYRVELEGWWAYPCRKCGTLIWPSVWGRVDQRIDDREA